MREEMRLKGVQQTVDRLLSRIRNYYNDQTIMPEDFAPNGPSYNMSKVEGIGREKYKEVG